MREAGEVLASRSVRSTVQRFGKLHRYEELALTERERNTRTYTLARVKEKSPSALLVPFQRKRPLIGQVTTPAREVYGI